LKILVFIAIRGQHILALLLHSFLKYALLYFTLLKKNGQNWAISFCDNELLLLLNCTLLPPVMKT